MTKKIWIYEYKDDKTPVGATFFEGPYEDLVRLMPLELPRLRGDWHWMIEELDW